MTSSAARLGIFVVFALLVAIRAPEIWTHGRFWAEEGAVYFMNARMQPWYDALFAVHTGYLNLSASLATLLADRFVSLEAAPWVSTSFAYIIQLCPAILLVTCNLEVWRRPTVLAVALLLMLTPNGSGEVWLNSITSQFHLAVCVALILALPTAYGWVGAFRMVLLVLAPLSGPASAFLTPLFLLRGALDRSPTRLVQGLLLGAMAGVQLLMVVLHPEPGRSIGIGPRLLLLVIYEKQLVLPFMGFNHALNLVGDMKMQVRHGVTYLVPMMITVTAAVVFGLAVWRSQSQFLRWLAISAVILMLMSYFGALGDHFDLLDPAFGDRYAFAPDILLGLTLLGVAQTERKIVNWIAGFAVVWLLLVAATSYFNMGSDFAKGSRWADEVSLWRLNHSYRVHLWPSELEVWHWPMQPKPGE